MKKKIEIFLTWLIFALKIKIKQMTRNIKNLVVLILFWKKFTKLEIPFSLKIDQTQKLTFKN